MKSTRVKDQERSRYQGDYLYFSLSFILSSLQEPLPAVEFGGWWTSMFDSSAATEWQHDELDPATKLTLRFIYY